MQVLDFDQAVRNTFETLTFSEKALAQDLLYSRQHDIRTSRAWVRAPTFTLSQALAQARSVPEARFKVRTIEIYCDTLTIDCPLSPEGGPASTERYAVFIFARKLVAPDATAQDASLTVTISPGCEIMLLTPSIPANFEISFVSKGKEVCRNQPVVEYQQFGVMYSYDAKSSDLVRMDQVSPPDSTFESIDYLSLIKPDGSVQDKGFLNDDFPRLLQMQLLVAQANSTLDKQFALSVLDYVVAASATAYNVYLNYQACSLRNSWLLDADVMAVSSVNIYSSKQVLKARLQAALAFETSFKDFTSQSGNTEYQVMTGLNLLAKSDDALETYAFLLSIKQREYDNAIESEKKATTTFNSSQAEIKTRTAEFQTGVENFKKAEERKAIFECMMAAVEIAGALTATVATGGMAAPGVAAAASGAAKTAGKMATLVKKLKAIFEKLKDIYEKIKPVIEKLRVLVTTAKAVVEHLSKLNEVTDNALALQPDVKSTDVINATAEWRRFSLEVTNMEESIREYDIDGKPAFFTSLKKLVINGETFILAQANLVQKGDELATVTIQKKMENRDKDRLSSMVYNVSASGKVLEFLRRAMFERLLAIRGLVYLDFATYCSAYSYHTLRRENPISLSPVKPVADFLEDAAKLQGAVVSYGSRVLIQSRKFTLRTLCGYEKAEDLAADLSKGNPVKVAVNPEASLWKGFSRIRVSVVRCYLEGVSLSQPASDLSTGSVPTVQMQLRTDGRFYDIQDSRPDSAGLVVDTPAQDQSQLVRSFVGDARRLLFEYQPSDGAIVCDGMFGQERDYTKHSPITTWEISLPQRSETLDLPSPSLDFKSFSGVRMEFVCDVVWSGY